MFSTINAMDFHFADLFLPSPYLYEQQPDSEEQIQTAAVLILLREGSDEEAYTAPFQGSSISSTLSVLLNVRSRCLRRHPGEICFPGGMRDVHIDRTPVDTALREAYEEIGLPPSLVRVLGTLEPVISLHHVRIFPVLARLLPAKPQNGRQSSNFQPFFNRAEVESHFWAPLERFLSSMGHQSFAVPFDGTNIWMHLFQFDEHHVFGLTAILCIAVAIGILRRLPDYSIPALRLSMESQQQEGAFDPVGRHLRAIFQHFGQLRQFIEPKNILNSLPSKL